MPPRWLSVGIVAGWLAATGWLFWHDLWPHWRPGEPPQFHIDLVEEVGNNNNPLKTHWDVQCKKDDDMPPEDIFTATTWVEYHPQDDTFTLHAELKAKPRVKSRAKPRADARAPRAAVFEFLNFQVELEFMKSKYRVDRAGQLRELGAAANFRKIEKNQETSKPPLIEFTLEGKVRDDQLHAHCRAVSSILLKPLEMDLPPAPVAHNGSVLLPLHPVNRIHGLHPGQSWRQPLVDPIRDAFGSLLNPSGGVHYLNARVLPRPQLLKEGDNSQISCLVIEYTDEDGQDAGRTWVEQDSERVQQQEAVLDGERWIMKRDNPRRANKRP